MRSRVISLGYSVFFSSCTAQVKQPLYLPHLPLIPDALSYVVDMSTWFLTTRSKSWHQTFQVFVMDQFTNPQTSREPYLYQTESCSTHRFAVWCFLKHPWEQSLALLPLSQWSSLRLYLTSPCTDLVCQCSCHTRWSCFVSRSKISQSARRKNFDQAVHWVPLKNN